jgi:hypothetical protein
VAVELLVLIVEVNVEMVDQAAEVKVLQGKTLQLDQVVQAIPVVVAVAEVTPLQTIGVLVLVAVVKL